MSLYYRDLEQLNCTLEIKDITDMYIPLGTSPADIFTCINRLQAKHKVNIDYVYCKKKICLCEIKQFSLILTHTQNTEWFYLSYNCVKPCFILG